MSRDFVSGSDVRTCSLNWIEWERRLSVIAGRIVRWRTLGRAAAAALHAAPMNGWSGRIRLEALGLPWQERSAVFRRQVPTWQRPLDWRRRHIIGAWVQQWLVTRRARLQLVPPDIVVGQEVAL